MPSYALITGGIVRNVIVAASVIDAQSFIPGSTAVDVTSLRVSLGDTYNGSVFSPGPPPTPAFPTEAVQDLFGGKVTPAELTSLGVAIQTDQQLRVIWDLFAGQRLSSSAFLDALVSKGLITSLRREQFKV